MFPINDLAMVTFVKPVVPEGPLTVKLISLVVELKASSVIVEFEIIEKGEDRMARVWVPTVSFMAVKLYKLSKTLEMLNAVVPAVLAV